MKGIRLTGTPAALLKVNVRYIKFLYNFHETSTYFNQFLILLTKFLCTHLAIVNTDASTTN